MQNVFLKVGEKHDSDHVTIYRNTHVLVLFKNHLDNTVILTITQCISRGKKYGDLVDMLHHVLDHHRYIVIMGDLKTSPKLKYHTNIFATDPIPHQTCIIWKNKILAEKKSFPNIMSLASVKKVFFLHSPWQNMQIIETMFPLQRVKLYWFSHQRIRMEW